MKTILHAIPLFIFLIISQGSGSAQEAKKELAKFQGTWNVSQLTYNGKVIEGEKANFKLVFKKDKFTVEGNDAVKKEYATIFFKVDTGSMPRLFDMTVLGGVQKGVDIEGIYEFKDEELRICAKVFGKERPTKFESSEGSSVVLLMLKRPAP
jgi:uncharacterized protein (TIGR03067 family)